MQFWIFLIASIFLLDWKSVTIAGTGIDCDWPIARYQCPLYGTLEWDCLEAKLSCGAGERYHCVRSEAGDWVEVCGQEKICGKGEEPVYSKTLEINCQPCHDPERFEPQANTPSYTYSECRRKKNVCPVIVSTECQIGDRYSENRKCRCMYEKQFIPQGYDMGRDTWRCADPDQLNCVQETCPETADGRKQFRGPDYRCSPDIVPPQPIPTQTPPYILSTKPSVMRIPIRKEDDSAKPVGLTVVAVLLIILTVCFIIYMVYRRVKGKKEPPGVPREPFEASSEGYTRVCLTWSPPEYHGGSPVSSYCLEWQQNESEDWASSEIPVKHEHVTYVPARTHFGKLLEPKTTIEEKNITYTVTGLKDGTTYLFRVRAKNKQGFGEPLMMKGKISTKELKAPGIPLDFTGYFNMLEKCFVLEWKPPKDDGGQSIIGYDLQYCSIMTKRKETDWVPAEIVKNNTCWKGPNFTGGLWYGFRVTAQNEKGLGETCELKNTIQFLSAPSAPAQVKVTKKESDNVMLTIQPPKNNGGLKVDSYWIRWKQVGEEWTKEDEMTFVRARSEAVTVRVAKLTPEKSYYFGVCAENTLGKGNFLDTDSATVLPRKLARPDRPVDPFKVSDIKPTQLLLSWEPPLDDGGTPITSYLLSRKLPYQYSSEKTIGKTENTQYLVTNLEEGKEYLFFVRAQNEMGNSEALENKFRTSVAKVPGKPAGPLHCTNLTHNSVTLTWNPPEDDGGAPVTGYDIESLFFYNHALINLKFVKKEITSYTVGDLCEGERYTFRIHAINRRGRSEKLETDEAVVPRRKKVAPGPPDSLRANLKEGKIELSWKPPKSDRWSKIEKYHIYLSEGSGSKVCLATLEASFTSYNVPNLSLEKQYYFEVVAENEVGPGDAARTDKPVSMVRVQEHKRGSFLGGLFSGGKSITEKQRRPSTDKDMAFEATEDTQKNEMVKSENGGTKTVNNLAPEDIPLPGADIPSTPIGPLRVENVTSCSVDLSWKHPALDGGAAITEYEVEYKLHKQPSWKRAGSVAGTICTYQVTELLEGTEYSFRVTAYNEEGPSKPLESDSATKTKAKLDLPDAPEHLETIKKGQNSVRLRWKKPKNFEGFECTGFIVSKRHSATEEWQMIEKVPWRESSYLVSDLPYRDVYFSVAAENVAGIGRSIETKKPETLTYPRGRPSAPLGPLRAVDIDETELTLVWHPPEFNGDYEIDKYRLLKKDWPARHWNFIETVPGQVNKFHVTGLTKGGKYAFSVEAVNKKGAGEPLETDSFVVTKTLTVPLPPSGPLQYSDVTETSVKLNWIPPGDDDPSITSYFIEYHDTKASSVDYWDKYDTTVPGYVTEWTLTGLTPGHSYKFCIIAVNAKGESEPLVCKKVVHLKQALQGQQNTPRSNAQSQGRGNVGGISDREIDSIAHKIGFDWEMIGTLLDYQSSQIDNLKHIYKDQPVTRNSRMIKMWADVVASCGESPRILLAAAFASRQNIEMAELLVPAEQVEAIRDQEARQETKEKIKLINFDIPGHSSQSRRSPVVATGGAGGINFFGEVTIGSLSIHPRAGSS